MHLIEADRVVVATGSSPARLPVVPSGQGVYVADDIFTMTSVPSHLLVVGGGSIGVEMAAIFRELGARVTLIEAQHHILPAEDTEMSEYLKGIFKRRGIKVLCGLTVDKLLRENERYVVTLSDGGELHVDAILVAVGRDLNTKDIGLEQVGVELDHGKVLVDEHMRTCVPWLYAAGDVTGGWLLAHVAFAEGVCAAQNALGLETKISYEVIPRTTFTMPEYAAVGLSEESARSHPRVKVARIPLRSIGMAHAVGEIEGFVKLIVHADTDRILGAHIIGPHAGDLIAEISLAMRAGMPSKIIMETIHGHPTLSEAVLEAAQAIHGQAIHALPQGGD